MSRRRLSAGIPRDAADNNGPTITVDEEEASSVRRRNAVMRRSRSQAAAVEECGPGATPPAPPGSHANSDPRSGVVWRFFPGRIGWFLRWERLGLTGPA